MIKKLLPYLGILICLLPILFPLYSASILGSADNLAHLFRVVNLDYAIGQGYIWPRWAALEGHGFGAPIFNFNYVLPYYICLVLWRLFGSLLTGSQVYMMLALVGSGWAMYAFLQMFYTRASSILGAIAYVYMPYHLMTVYLYGGYGEALAYVWVPLICLSTYQSTVEKSRSAFFGAIIYLSLLILSHNLSALMTIGLLGTMMLIFGTGEVKRIYVFLRLGLIFGMSALLTAWFWLPSIMEQHMTKLGLLFEKETALRGYFFELIAPVWHNSIRALRFEHPGYYSYAIGIPAVFAAVVGCIVLASLALRSGRKLRFTHAQKLGVYFLLWYVVSFVLTRKISEPIWDMLPARINFLSYPYRFFFINSFVAAGVSAFIFHHLFRKMGTAATNIWALIFISIYIWQGVIYAHPAIDTFSFGPEYFTYTQTVRSAPHTYKNMGYIEFIPTSANSDFVNGLDSNQQIGLRAQVTSGNGIVRIVSEKAQDMYVDIVAQTPVTLVANILYFPGWVGYKGTQKILPQTDSVGRILFSLPAGQYRLHVIFQNTPIRTIAEGISLVTSGLLGTYLFILISKRK